MTKSLIALRINVEKSLERRIGDRREAGQGTLEYIGAILIAAVLIGLVYTAVSGYDLGGKVKSAIDKVFSSAGG